MVDLADPTAYQHMTLNPSNRVPEYGLRLAFKKAGLSGQIPMKALIALADGGYTSSQTFATAFGSDRDKAEDRMANLPEIRDNVATRESLRRAQLGFLLTVWEDLYGKHKARRELVNKNSNVADPTTIVVPIDTKNAIKR